MKASKLAKEEKGTVDMVYQVFLLPPDCGCKEAVIKYVLCVVILSGQQCLRLYVDSFSLSRH